MLVPLLASALLAASPPGAASPIASPPAACSPFPSPAGAHAAFDTLRIVEEETILSVVVRTEGLVARFAPDHLIYAPEYQADLVLDPERPEDASFTARVWVPDFVADEPEQRRELQDRLLELGILDRPYGEMSEDDREDVRAAMLDDGQLHAAEHPWIEVETVGIEESGEGDFPWTVTVALTVREQRVEEPMRARLEPTDDGRIRVEAFGAFHFTDLGIDPYRAFLGAVRNRDEFHLYLDLLAEPPAGG